jgi:hypothetical protein
MQEGHSYDHVTQRTEVNAADSALRVVVYRFFAME